MGAVHRHDLGDLVHSHSFSDEGAAGRERALGVVTLLTLATMVVELAAGWWSGSLALTADGWHMGTHALALGGAVLAYRLSRRASRDGAGRFVFGGWKIEVLAAYTSGLALMAVALGLAWDSISALQAPRQVAWHEAMGVAVLGLAVNLASVWLLRQGTDAAHAGPGHGHGHAHGHGHVQGDVHGDDHAHRHAQHHGHHHDHAHERADTHASAHHPSQAHASGHGHDHNFSAAYLHVLADALTSVLAIVALAAGAWWGIRWLDPAVALLGAALIGRWSWNMLRDTARVLVDATDDPSLAARVRALIEQDGDAQVIDLHVWQVGSRAWCAALSVVADLPRPAHEYRRTLDALPVLRHVTVEVHRCRAAE